MRTPYLLVRSLAVLLVVVATGCGGPADGPGPSAGAPDTDEPVTDTDEPVTDAHEAGVDLPDAGESDPSSSDGGAAGSFPALPEVRDVREGVEGVTSRPFEEARFDETDGSLHVGYWTGVEPCYVLAEVEVDAGPDEVTITLHEGHLPDEDGQAPVCIELAEQASTRIPLEEPLGDREVIDGTTGEPVPVLVIDADEAPTS